MVVWCLFFVERCDAGNCCGGLIGKDDIFFSLDICFFDWVFGLKTVL